jgi:hypothetical protein
VSRRSRDARMNNNRRRFPRYQMTGLRGSIDGQPCELVLLGLGGLLATSRLEPELERTIHLEFPLQSGETFRSTARVAFIGPDMRREARGWNRIGVEFLAVPTRSRRALETFLALRNAPGLKPEDEADE